MSFVSRQTRLRVAAFVTFIALLSLGILGLGFNVGWMQSQLEQAGPWAPVFFIAIATSLMSLCIPKTAVSLTAGAMFGVAQGMALLMVVVTLAAASNYCIGYAWFGRGSSGRSSSGRSRPSPQREPDSFVAAIMDVAAKAGFWLHTLVRLSPVPTMMISYGMGAVQARFTPYIIAAILASIPQVLWVHSGAKASQVAASQLSTSPADSMQWLGLVVSLGVAVIATIAIAREAKRQLVLGYALPQEPHL